MKRLFTAAIAALVVSPATAQITQPDTPLPFTEFRQEYGGDGSMYTMTSLGGYAVYFDLPFSMDFTAGWSFVVGKRTKELDSVFIETPAWGFEVYGLKYIGGRGAFIRTSLRAIMDSDPDDARRAQGMSLTAAVSIGFKM